MRLCHAERYAERFITHERRCLLPPPLFLYYARCEEHADERGASQHYIYARMLRVLRHAARRIDDYKETRHAFIYAAMLAITIVLIYTKRRHYIL